MNTGEPYLRVMVSNPSSFFSKKDFYVIRCQTNQSIKQFANTTVDVLFGDI